MMNSMKDKETYISRATLHGPDACARPVPGSKGISRGSDAGAGGDSLS